MRKPAEGESAKHNEQGHAQSGSSQHALRSGQFIHPAETGRADAVAQEEEESKDHMQVARAGGNNSVA